MFLKKCPLCGRINTHSCRSCVDCGWSGAFEIDAEVVREALLQIYSEPEAEGSALHHWLRKILDDRAE